MASEGYVYILANSYLPQLVKIGFTDREPALRATELSGTGVPGRWTVVKAWYVQDAGHWERHIFGAMADHRETGEFFRLSPEQAVELVFKTLLSSGAVDVEGIAPFVRARQRRGEALRQSAEEREAREQERQRCLDEAWAAGKERYVMPWCRLMESCDALRKEFRPQGAISTLWKGREDVLERMRRWPGYEALKAKLPDALTLSRQARSFILRIGWRYPTTSRGRWFYGSPTGVDTAWPCKNAWLPYMEATGKSQPTPADYALEIRLAVQSVYGFDGDTAQRFLTAEKAVAEKLLRLAQAELPGDFVHRGPESQG